MNITHAIVLAAGLGTRMRPLTETIPKPLVPVRGVTLIDWCLDWLAEAGIAEVVVNSSYRAAQLEAHLAARMGQGSQHLYISREEPAPLETGGGIARALPLLGNAPFLAMNSDAIFLPSSPHPVLRMAQAFAQAGEGVDFLMLLIPRKKAIGWHGNGDFLCDEQGRIRRPREGEDAPYVFSGVEVIHPRVFAGCPEGAFSLSRLWNAGSDGQGNFPRIRALVHTGDWLNVGDLAGLATAEAYLA